jgi:hypothetical protein
MTIPGAWSRGTDTLGMAIIFFFPLLLRLSSSGSGNTFLSPALLIYNTRAFVIGRRIVLLFTTVHTLTENKYCKYSMFQRLLYHIYY